MEIGGIYGSGGIENIFAAELDASKRYTKVQSETTPSGDTVSISDDAKKLYSEMIHKYDHASSQGGEGADTGAEGGQGSGGAGGAGGADESSSVEEIKKQIESLKSQLSALASQMGGGADAAAMGKMNALQAQIAALEAQLNQMG